MHRLTFFPHWMRHREWNQACFVRKVFVIILHENDRQSEESHIVANTVLMGKKSLNFYTTAWMEVLNERAPQTRVQRLRLPSIPRQQGQELRYLNAGFACLAMVG